MHATAVPGWLCTLGGCPVCCWMALTPAAGSGTAADDLYSVAYALMTGCNGKGQQQGVGVLLHATASNRFYSRKF